MQGFQGYIGSIHFDVWCESDVQHDEIHKVRKEPPPADFALLNSEKSGGGLVLILTNLTARYNLSDAS